MPRDPKRIAVILSRLRAIWEANPELRLGQLIGNLNQHEVDMYYEEDISFIERLEEFYFGNSTDKE